MRIFKIAFTISALCVLLLTSMKCKKDYIEKNELPPITQTGANTFSCLINGKLFIPKQELFSPKPLTSDFNSNSNSLYIRAYNADNNSAITIYINDIYQGVNSYYFTKSSLLIMSDKAYIKYRVDNPLTQNYSTELTGQGNVTISRSDNGILSGTFEFVAQNEDNANDNVTCTKGRFDLVVNGIK